MCQNPGFWENSQNLTTLFLMEDLFYLQIRPVLTGCVFFSAFCERNNQISFRKPLKLREMRVPPREISAWSNSWSPNLTKVLAIDFIQDNEKLPDWMLNLEWNHALSLPVMFLPTRRPCNPAFACRPLSPSMSVLLRGHSQMTSVERGWEGVG